MFIGLALLAPTLLRPLNLVWFKFGLLLRKVITPVVMGLMIIDVKDDGSFWLDQSCFDYCTGLRMTNDKFSALFGQPLRQPDRDPLTQFHMDIAASIQAVTEDVVLKLALNPDV